MSKAEAGMKLVRWLANQGDDVVASAKDLAQFGPQATRVRALLDFIPTMSDDAARISSAARDVGRYAARKDAIGTTRFATGNSPFERVGDVAANAAGDAARDVGRFTIGNASFSHAWDAARDAATGEVVSDLVTPNVYRTLTNPLAAGRAFDVLRPRAPENFLDVVRGLGERGLVRQPVDVLSVRTLARAPKSEREALMEVINAIAGDTGYADTGYDSLAELIEAARLLG